MLACCCICDYIYFYLQHARLFVDALRSPSGKGLSFWPSFFMSKCDIVTLHLIVLIPDLCPLSYYDHVLQK